MVVYISLTVKQKETGGGEEREKPFNRLHSVRLPCPYYWLSRFLYYLHFIRHFSTSNPLFPITEPLLPTLMFIHSFINIPEIQKNIYRTWYPFCGTIFSFPGRGTKIVKSNCYLSCFLSFRRFLNSIYSFLGNFSASEFLLPTFRNSLSVPSS